MPSLLQDRLTLHLKPEPGSLAQDKRHVRDQYARLLLSPEQQAKVCYTKITSNAALVDFRPDPNHPWVEQVTAHERVNMVDEDGTPVHVNAEDESGGIADTAGVIMTFHGTAARVVALDVFGGVPRMISLEEAEMQETATEVHYPRFTLWEFRLHEAIYTDGPERNSRLQEAAEEQRARAEEASLNSQKAFYEQQRQMNVGMMSMLAQVVSQIGDGGGKVDASAFLDAVSKSGLTVPADARPEDLPAPTEDQKAAMEEWEKIGGNKPDKASSTAEVEDIDISVEPVKNKGGRPRKS